MYDAIKSLKKTFMKVAPENTRHRGSILIEMHWFVVAQFHVHVPRLFVFFERRQRARVLCWRDYITM